MEDKELYEILMSMDSKLNHMEDTFMDYRDILIKIVNQGNTVVKFLSNFELDSVDTVVDSEMVSGKLKDVAEIINDYSLRFEELQEFEKELEKHKDEITTGQIGES